MGSNISFISSFPKHLPLINLKTAILSYYEYQLTGTIKKSLNIKGKKYYLTKLEWLFLDWVLSSVKIIDKKLAK